MLVRDGDGAVAERDEEPDIDDGAEMECSDIEFVAERSLVFE